MRALVRFFRRGGPALEALDQGLKEIEGLEAARLDERDLAA